MAVATTTGSVPAMGHKMLLACGILSSVLYVGGDILASLRYPGYNYLSQAVSELFAIGAPTSALVVPAFTLSSVCLLAFARGVWLSSRQDPLRRAMAWLMAANAADALVLWNLFPMHMRNVAPTLTDTMHLVFAVNPFVLATLVVAVAAFHNRFRVYSLGTALVLLITAVAGFSYAAPLAAHQATPFLGLAERIAQYANLLWRAVLAIMLLREPVRV